MIPVLFVYVLGVAPQENPCFGGTTTRPPFSSGRRSLFSTGLFPQCVEAVLKFLFRTAQVWTNTRINLPVNVTFDVPGLNVISRIANARDACVPVRFVSLR